MTHEEMIAMAREAGCVEPSHPFNPWSVSQEALKRFAAFVIAKERERCALVCERKIVAPAGTYQILMAAADAIRKGE